jgi:hypothetical protein
MTSGIIEILIENEALQNALGKDNRGQFKVYPTAAPQGVKYPYIVVAEESLNPSLSKDCISTLDYPLYQVLVYSTSFRQTEVIQSLCRAALENGGEGFSTDAGARFDKIDMIDRKDLYQQATGQDSGMYVKVGTYRAATRS